MSVAVATVGVGIGGFMALGAVTISYGVSWGISKIVKRYLQGSYMEELQKANEDGKKTINKKIEDRTKVAEDVSLVFATLLTIVTGLACIWAITPRRVL